MAKSIHSKVMYVFFNNALFASLFQLLINKLIVSLIHK